MPERESDGVRRCSVVEPDAVREQLDRVLASAVFRNSKRYSSLLRYVVEQTLDGRSDRLKERAIGIDVFERPADYNTTMDHAVRSAAGEVRKRLAQYYMEPGRESEIRIDLQAGSYVPQFRSPAEKPEASTTLLPAVASVLAAERFAERRFWEGSVSRRGRAVLAVAGIAVLLVAGVAAKSWMRPQTAFERFWNPVFSSTNPALLCFGGGQPTPATDGNPELTVRDFERMPQRRMHVSDALALTALGGLLQSNGKPYRILNRAGATSFKDLQSGPFILIGGMNNQWTRRLTGGLRFTFEKLPNGAYITDKQNSSNTAWSVDFTTPLDRFTRDYAIVSRVRDSETEQIAVIVAGIGSWGTQAAGEFVANASHLKKLEALAPRNWEQKNLQVVIATDVIRGSSGPPNVLAAHFW
ncbi:MAG TPA: hypothetical protein VGZ73_17180 [Bryobacteraceae bacterium]|nr:hypothetical protein [Bryobacteraceae bacterium]